MGRVPNDQIVEVQAMKWSMISLAVAVILLLLSDLLAFHDLFEAHTVRDWLVLVASALAVVALAGGSAGLLRTIGRRG
jgi:hypothetical protein